MTNIKMKIRMNTNNQKIIKSLHFSDSEDSDFDDVPTAPAFQQKPTTVKHMSMPSFLDSAVPLPPPLRPVAEPQKQQPDLLQAQQPPLQSMPQFLNGCIDCGGRC